MEQEPTIEKVEEIKEIVKEVLKDVDGAELLNDMNEATEFERMAAEQGSISRKHIIAMQKQAFKMMKRTRRRGDNNHQTKKGKYQDIADNYYGKVVRNLKIYVKKAQYA